MNFCRTVLASTLLVVPLAACSESREDVAQTGVDVELTRQQIADALDGGLFDASRTDQLVAECMAESGFVWLPAAVDPGAAIVDAEFVELYGYGIFSAPDVVEGDDPNLAVFNEMSPAEQGAYNLALVGNEEGASPISSDSCFGRELKALQLLSDIASSELMQKILNEYESLLQSAPEIEVAGLDWRACMKAAGFSYENRDEIIGELTELAESKPTGDALIASRERELQLARSDYGCSGPTLEAAANAAERIKAELIDRYAP